MSKYSQRVTIDIVPTTTLAQRTWDEMWRLTEIFYDTDRDYAERKLKEHQRIGLFRTAREGTLIGMVSMDIYPIVFQKRRLAVIYTSHVLLHEQYRGHNLIQRMGFRSFIEARLRFPLRPIYWFFDTFSYKSYLLLPRNFRDFWPRFDRQTPVWEHAFMNHLAAQTYGSAWQPESGVVARSGQKRLRPEVAPLADHSKTLELDFFAQKNPHHADGDMLVCLCPLTSANWFSVASHAFRRSRRAPRKRSH